MEDIDRLKSRKLLCQALNNPEANFREGQWQAITQLVHQKSRLLMVQRTGWGKSLVYFLATKLLRDRGAGPTLLISPLLALMRNQLEAAKRLGVMAATLNSANKDEWEPIQQALLNDSLDLLLISPERLANESFRENILMEIAQTIGLFVVDEAHCISDWGHDFRPDYRRITRILQALPSNLPMLATTATANDRVVGDVTEQLGPNLQLIRGPLRRNSLYLQNIDMPEAADRLALLAEKIPKIPGCGIVYTLTVQDARQVADWLQQNQIDAEAYWGGLDTPIRLELEERLLKNQIKVLVATSALGMGFDKPDLGFVIHYQRPQSVIHYYQQVGRAGRAMEQAFGFLLSGDDDDEIIDYFIHNAYPKKRLIQEILAALEESPEGLNIRELERCTNYSFGEINKTIKILATESPALIAPHKHSWYRTTAPYQPDMAKTNTLISLRMQEKQRMIDYLHHDKCLAVFLAAELDDPDTTPCGKCAPCRGKPLMRENQSEAKVIEAQQFLELTALPIQPIKQWPKSAFPKYGWQGNIAKELHMEEGRALCRWGDPGWGRMVRDGKQKQGRFDDQLVVAMAEMIRERWQPEPMPTWICPIPSTNHPRLVLEFSERLGQALALPVIACVEKTKPTQPQKEMQNRYQQAHNLDGAFHIEALVMRDEPVLLVDDMVHSRWTLTVVAALLRNRGSGPVFPVTLAQVISR
ncbi:MAG: ATP-dependent DNA helicase RecQ [Magnetococcales bacterium]|nr:ATP-dependent DNA helicase RecQ [Magnetococcales bacterium]